MLVYKISKDNENEVIITGTECSQNKPKQRQLIKVLLIHALLTNNKK